MENMLQQAESVIVDFWTLFNDPERIAAMLEMLPAAIALIGLVLSLILLVTGGRMHGLRWATVVLYAAGAGLVGWMLAESGDELPWTDHARWIVLALPAVLIALSAIPRKAARFSALILALLVAIPTSGSVGLVIHFINLETTRSPDPGTQTDPTRDGEGDSDRDNPDAGADADQPTPDQTSPDQPSDDQDQPSNADENQEPANNSAEEESGGSIFDFGRY